MKRSTMLELLNSSTVKHMPTVFIPSYNRPDFVIAKKVLCNFNQEGLDKVFIVVRDEQYKAYRKINPHLNYVTIPKGTVTGVGSTRQFIMDYALENKLACIMDMDDDITYLHYLFNRRSQRTGQWCSAHSTIADEASDPLIPQKVLQLAGKIAREVFREHPDVLLGNIRKQHFSQSKEFAQAKYYINKGPTPRQTKILNMKGIKKAGIRMPEAFDLHGDDIGFVAEVLQNGYSCFNIPCLCYDYIDDQVASVVRDPHNPDKNRWLHKLEYDGLQQMEIKHYLRETFKFPDGQYKFGDVDWGKYHKLHKSQPIVELW